MHGTAHGTLAFCSGLVACDEPVHRTLAALAGQCTGQRTGRWDGCLFSTNALCGGLLRLVDEFIQ